MKKNLCDITVEISATSKLIIGLCNQLGDGSDSLFTCGIIAVCFIWNIKLFGTISGRFGIS